MVKVGGGIVYVISEGREADARVEAINDDGTICLSYTLGGVKVQHNRVSRGTLPGTFRSEEPEAEPAFGEARTEEELDPNDDSGDDVDDEELAW